MRISDIEAAIVHRLERQVPHLRTCSTLADFLARSVQEIGEAAILTPAAWVVYESGTYDHCMGGVQDRRMVFAVIVMTCNFQGDHAARHGFGSDPGVYDLLDSVRAALTEESCGLDIDPLLPVSEGAIDGSREASMYGIRFETRCREMI